MSKIGTGLTEDDLKALKVACDKIKIKEMPKGVDVNKMFTPDVIVRPELVVEIGADEISISPSHTAGYALRFPRLIKFRHDKKPQDATTVEEIKKIHKNQRK